MKNYFKLTLSLIACVLCTVSFAQSRKITLTGQVEGLNAIRVCVVTGERGQSPIEIAFAVVDNGKFSMSFEEDPTAGKRYAFYVPTLDSDRFDNAKSREYFFVDDTKLHIVGKVANQGIVEFDLPKSKMYQQFRQARNKIDFGPYRAQEVVESEKLQAMHKYRMDWEETHQMGDEMTADDSLNMKRLSAIWKKEAEKFFALEYGLGLQAVEQINGKHNRGLNALICDHFNGNSAVSMKPMIDKYHKEFGPDYMAKDFYLSQLWDTYIQRLMPLPDTTPLVFDYPLQTIDGTKVGLGEFKGKYIYVNFWDLEDPDHQKQNDAMEVLAAKFADSKDVVVVNLSMNRDPSLWRAILTGSQAKVVQWSVPDTYVRAFYRSYDVEELPRAVLIGPDFHIMKFHAPIPTDPATEALLSGLTVK